MTVVNTTIRNRRIDVPAPSDLLDGKEVVVTIDADSADDEAMPADEIAWVLASMRHLQPLEIPAETAADLETWERKLRQHGIDIADKGIEEVFQ